VWVLAGDLEAGYEHLRSGRDLMKATASRGAPPEKRISTREIVVVTATGSVPASLASLLVNGSTSPSAAPDRMATVRQSARRPDLRPVIEVNRSSQCAPGLIKPEPAHFLVCEHANQL